MTPAQSTDGAAGVPGGHWYIGIVSPRSEKSVRDKLLRSGREAYAATRREIHIWRRGERRAVEKVLITNIVFVRASERELVGLKPFGILSYMRDAARESAAGRMAYATVRDEELTLLRAMLAQEDYTVSFAPQDFVLGESVRVLGFDADDQEGRIVRLPHEKGGKTGKEVYVGVRLSFLGCAYMQVPVEQIRKK